MKAPRLLACSILLNLIFLGTGLWSLTRQPATAPAPAVLPPTALTPAPAAPFRWSQLEAGDYPTYIANLRAIGCPEETIRDLITADVASQYEEKRRQLMAAGPHPSGALALAAGQVPEPLQPVAGQESVTGSNTGPAASPHPARPLSAAPALQSLVQEQAALLAALLPAPPAPGAETKEASPAAPQAAAADEPSATSSPQPAAGRNPPTRLARDLRQRGI